MRSVKELRKKAKASTRGKAQMYSTSEARANFAEALETAQLDNTVIGFDRYGRPVAALVPIDAVRLLAGRDREVEPAVRDKIERMARAFMENVPSRGRGVAEPAATYAPRKAKAPAKTSVKARPRPKRRAKRKGVGKLS